MLTNLITIKLLSILIIFCTALFAGVYPFLKKWRSGVSEFPLGQALASGVFLGAGLIHMLGDANADFMTLHYNYPIAFVIAGSVFLLFLALEHLGNEFYEHKDKHHSGFAIIAFVLLSIHSLFAGAALGLSSNLAIVLVLLAAIVAHKWAASFALATQITQSGLDQKVGWLLFFIFTIMTPLGIYIGSTISTALNNNALIEPIFNAIAAGTFLYLGTLHGLSRSFMLNKCCDLKNFTYVIIGFTIMAVVAIWT
ncbi:MAG: ZIP family metal transporter [Pseudomonadota bacterium]